jgi:uncharacterized protein DUF6907
MSKKRNKAIASNYLFRPTSKRENRRIEAATQPCPPWCAGLNCESVDRGRRLHHHGVGDVDLAWHHGHSPKAAAIRNLDVSVRKWTFRGPLDRVHLSGPRVFLCINDRGDGYSLLPGEARALAEHLASAADLLDASRDHGEVVRDILDVQRRTADPCTADAVRALLRVGLRYAPPTRRDTCTGLVHGT